METHHQGARNAGRPMLLEGGLDWKPMGFSPSDMEFHETKAAAAREIAVAFGVPPMLLGIPGDATYANYQEAHRAFYRLTVLPLATRVTAAVAWWLPAYTDDWDETGREELLWAAARRHLLSLSELSPEGPGQVLLFRMRDGAVAKHLGITAQTGAHATFIHAAIGKRGGRDLRDGGVDGFRRIRALRACAGVYAAARYHCARRVAGADAGLWLRSGGA